MLRLHVPAELAWFSPCHLVPPRYPRSLAGWASFWNIDPPRDVASDESASSNASFFLAIDEPAFLPTTAPAAALDTGGIAVALELGFERGRALELTSSNTLELVVDDLEPLPAVAGPGALARRHGGPPAPRPTGDRSGERPEPSPPVPLLDNADCSTHVLCSNACG
jgi:hypothetical protein